MQTCMYGFSLINVELRKNEEILGVKIHIYWSRFFENLYAGRYYRDGANKMNEREDDIWLGRCGLPPSLFLLPTENHASI